MFYVLSDDVEWAMSHVVDVDRNVHYAGVDADDADKFSYVDSVGQLKAFIIHT